MPRLFITAATILTILVSATGCIVPPSKPKAPAPGERLAARKIPRGVSPRDVWKKEIQKMGAEPLAIDPQWFAAFPDGRTPEEIIREYNHSCNTSDLWVKELIEDWKLLLKWRKELTAWLQESSFEFLDGDKDQLKEWKSKQSPPWPSSPGQGE